MFYILLDVSNAFNSTVLSSHENWLITTELRVLKFDVLLVIHSIKMVNVVLLYFMEKYNPFDMVISSMIIIISHMKS